MDADEPLAGNPPVLSMDEPIRPSDLLVRVALLPGSTRDAGTAGFPTDPGGVSLGRPLLFPVPAEELPSQLRRRAGAGGLRYYGVLFAFDLDPLPQGGQHAAVRFEVALADEGALAVQLHADGGALGLTFGAERARAVTPAADRAAAAAAARNGWLTRLAPRADRPRAWSFGAHRHRFGWNYEDAGGSGLPLTYGLHALIEVPSTTTVLTGRLGVRVRNRPGRLHTGGSWTATLHDTVPFREVLPDRVEHQGAAVRLCMAADVAGYSRRPNDLAARTQSWLVRVLREARHAAGIDESAVSLQFQGDGEFAVLPVGIDESRVIPRLVDGLDLALRRTNDGLGPAERMRLRFALHRGLMKPGDSGWVGAAAIAVHRILDSPPLRAALRDNPLVDYVLGVPDVLYQDVLRHSQLPPLPERFAEVTVDLPEKGFVEHCWLHVPIGEGP
ncbi:hypothetical protein [Micromonospora wenchangensis]|uniref:hypothetical protein n=1 Tax=Micromonospora wenchangensis TaxID=1185415 RepID=UPI0011841FDD|nr:hypothetical protein [Micromonospora wenchangensis]